MKRFLLTVCALVLACGAASAQTGTVAKGPDETVVRDLDAEKSARHELEVARTYFKNRKAYFSSLKRADELVAGYPEFSRVDEALYMAGMSAVYLVEGKGKQKLSTLPPNTVKEYTPVAPRVVFVAPAAPVAGGCGGGPAGSAAAALAASGPTG